LFEILRSFLS